MEWKKKELIFLVLYAVAFYAFIIRRSLLLSLDYRSKLHGLHPGWLLSPFLNDLSDAQWRNFRANLPILTMVFGLVAILVHSLRAFLSLRAKGMSLLWLSISLAYLSYLHGACIVFILSIASLNFLLVKIFAQTRYLPFVLWAFNIFFLLCNRIYEGYPFSMLGQQWAFLDNLRGTFRWQICFNFVILRMISFGYDYHWANEEPCSDKKKHIERCHICKYGKLCNQLLQDRGVLKDHYSFSIYLSYLLYPPLYIAGPIISFNSFASQIDMPLNNNTRSVSWYGLRWVFSLFLMELMTHTLHYNAFVISGLWKLLSPLDIFIVGYGVLNFMWLKFFLIWRYFRFWSLICDIEAPENMPRCINNCHDLQSFWKNWHASYNKWLVRYMYIPLGGSRRKLLNVWVIFTFVAIWHDIEWKLLSWAWLTCLFFVPEMAMKSAANVWQVESTIGEFFFRELLAVAGAITISCLMVANLVGYVVGPAGLNRLYSKFLVKDGTEMHFNGTLSCSLDIPGQITHRYTVAGVPVLAAMFVTFYVGTKLMFHIEDAKRRKQ